MAESLLVNSLVRDRALLWAEVERLRKALAAVRDLAYRKDAFAVGDLANDALTIDAREDTDGD